MKILFFLMLFIYSTSFAEDAKYSVEPYAKINSSEIDEGSALLASPLYPDVFWTLNDSGDKARIFALKANGEMIKPDWVKNYKGLNIYDAYNRDWECLTSDGNGYLYIFDAGNNFNYRRDLAFYKIAEPNPYLSDETGIIAKYPFKYPDQKAFPPEEEYANFDAEACFFDKGSLYLISKNRGKGAAKIYKFSNFKPNEENVPEIYAYFDFESMVTDAAISKDGKMLAVLTYEYLWLFERKSENFFSAKNWKKKINLGQCEGISFNGDEIIISNEKGFLFKLPVAEMKSLK